MKRFLIATVLALGLLLIPSVVLAAEGIEVVDKTGDGKWVGDTWSIDLYPGESGGTTLTLRNSSSSSLEAWVTIIPDSLDNGNVTFELNKTSFIMLAGSNTDVTLTARANGSATPGSYTAELEIKSEVPPAPTPDVGGGGGTPLYPIKTNLFGIEKTYYTELDGDLYKAIEGTSQDGNLTVAIPRRTTALGEDGRRLKTLEIAVDEAPPDPPKDTNIIGLPYTFSPSGATFEPSITFTWSYDPNALPEGVAEEDLVLAYYIDGEWVELECVVDTESNTVTATVRHFTTFALMVAVPRPPTPTPPAPPVVEEPTPPAPVVPEVIPAPEVTPPTLIPEEPEPTQWGLIIGPIVAFVIIVLAVWLFIRRRARRH